MTALLNGVAGQTNLRLQELSGNVKPKAVFGQIPRFTINADIVAIVLEGKPLHFRNTGSGSGRGGGVQFAFEINIFRFEARSIRVGDV